MTLDPDVGSEVVLLIADRTDFVYELRAKEPISIRSKALMCSPAGPLLALLWWVPPVVHGRPFVLYEHLLNPSKEETANLLLRAAGQTHLHVVVLGPQDRVAGVYEFQNTFEFQAVANLCAEVRRSYPHLDLRAAKEDYERRYSLDELFQMEDGSPDVS
jgi:hypothetical protein